ncbi:MAG: hypothetical protein WBG47_08795 [Gordonia sp. (in: high G+C Gram-positive bacteria)]|uniref:TPR repeat region-containing protein n=1 Tax=Gordonia sp. (in: high G+C Gram-positive bacteria) TaxID=84139 RepID=UPI003C75ADD7
MVDTAPKQPDVIVQGPGAPQPFQSTTIEPAVTTTKDNPAAGENPTTGDNPPPSGDQPPKTGPYSSVIPAIAGPKILAVKNSGDGKTPGEDTPDPDPTKGGLVATDATDGTSAADADVEILNSVPPEAPTKPPVRDGEGAAPGAYNPVQAEKEARGKSPEDWAKYDADMEKFRQREEAKTRFKANFSLTEQQKTDLSEGKDVDIPEGQKRYILDAWKKLAGTTGDSSKLAGFIEENPDLEAYLGASGHMATNPHVKSNGKPIDLSEMPPAFRHIAKPISPKYDFMTGQPLRTIDVPDMDEYTRLAKMLDSADDRYKNGSYANRLLLERGLEIKSVYAEFDHGKNGLLMVRSPSDYDDAQKLLINAGAKDRESSLALLRDNPAAVGQLMDGTDGSNAGLTVNERIKELQAQISAAKPKDPTAKKQIENLQTELNNLSDMVAGDPSLGDSRIPGNNPQGVYRILAYLDDKPNDKTTKLAAKNVAKYLATLSPKNQEGENKVHSSVFEDSVLLQTLAVSMKPHYAGLAGDDETLTLQNMGTLSSFMTTLYRDPMAGATATWAIKDVQDGLAKRYGKQIARGEVATDPDTIGALQAAMVKGFETAKDEGEWVEGYSKSIELNRQMANFDAASGAVNGLFGAIPGWGPVFAIGTLGITPLAKASVFKENSSIDLTSVDENQVLSFIETGDNDVFCLPKVIEGMVKQNPKIADTDDYKLWKITKAKSEKANLARKLVAKYDRNETSFSDRVDQGKGNGDFAPPE